MTLTSNLQFMLDRRGQTCTLRKITVGNYNPATGSTASSVNQDYEIKAYFAEYSLEELTKDSIVLGDRRVLIGSKNTSGVAIPEPDTEDQILTVGDTVVVKHVQKIFNGPELVCYICQVRE